MPLRNGRNSDQVLIGLFSCWVRPNLHSFYQHSGEIGQLYPWSPHIWSVVRDLFAVHSTGFSAPLLLYKWVKENEETDLRGKKKKKNEKEWYIKSDCVLIWYLSGCGMSALWVNHVDCHFLNTFIDSPDSVRKGRELTQYLDN